jgi:cell division ATPase FtsA
MEKGCVSADESSYPILASMLHGMINKITLMGPAVLYYSKPANAISQDTNVDLHGSLLQGIFESYEAKEGLVVQAMNEAAAVIFSECDDRTGFAISTGAGMINLAYVKWGTTVFSFSISQSGDWIDETVSQACSIPKAEVNLKKETVDISKAPTNQFELILKAQYELLIRSSIEKIIQGIEADKGTSSVNKPIPIVVAGGVSSIAGFMDTFRNIFDKYKFPMEISEIKRAEQGVKAIAHGLYEAARLHE